MDTQNSQSNTPVKAPLIVGVSLVLGLLFDYFFYDNIPGIGFPIYIGLILVGQFIISIDAKKQIHTQALWLFIPLMFFSSMVFVRSSTLLTFLNIVASLLLLVLVAEVSFVGLRKNLLVSGYVKMIFLPFKFIRPLFQTLRSIFKFQEVSANLKITLQVVKGILMALPVITIFVALFSSADLIFQKYLSNVVHIDIDPDTVVRSILVLCATIAFVGAYSYALCNKEDSTVPVTANDTAHTVGHIETSILLCAVNVLFFTFIVVQLAYFFGGEDSIVSQGFTYAEYARKGFFELLAVAAISFLLLFIMEKYTARRDTGHILFFKIASTALIVQVLIIMVSAFERLSFYEEAYGFTTLRLYSHAFSIFLAVIFILLLYKILKDARENAFAFRVFVSMIVFLAVMNGINPDVFIARRNSERFASIGTLDITYLNSLSDDAVPEIVKLLMSPNEELRKSVARELYKRTQNDSFSFPKWQSLTISRARANNILKSKMPGLEAYKDYKGTTY